MSIPATNSHTGFPSPADDYLQGALDLNEYLVHHRESTFFFRAKGNSMTAAGISDGDLLVVDKSITPSSGNIVVAVIDGELTVKRIVTQGESYVLKAEGDITDTIQFKDGQELQIWGVVTSVIRKLI